MTHIWKHHINKNLEDRVIDGCQVHVRKPAIVRVASGYVRLGGKVVRVNKELIYIPVNLEEETRHDWIVVNQIGQISRVNGVIEDGLLAIARVTISPKTGTILEVESFYGKEKHKEYATMSEYRVNQLLVAFIH